jgi:hypothetical protein
VEAFQLRIFALWREVEAAHIARQRLNMLLLTFGFAGLLRAAIGVWLTELFRQRSSQQFHNFLRLFTAV